VNIYETSTCLQRSSPQPLKAVDNLTTACSSIKFNSTAEILALASNMNEQGFKMVSIRGY